MIENAYRLSDIEKECIDFGMNVVIHQIICFIIAGLIAIVFGVLIELMFVITFFIPLRIYGGGYHASRPSYCLFYSGVMFTLMSICLKFFELDYSTLHWIFIISFLVVFGIVHQWIKIFVKNLVFIENTNQIKIILLVMLIIYVITFFIGKKHIMQYITLALNANVILLVMGIRNQILNLFKEKRTARF